MHIVDVGPISDNPQTYYQLVFGKNVSIERVLNSLKQIAEMREQCGLTTEQNTIETVKEAEKKLQFLLK